VFDGRFPRAGVVAGIGRPSESRRYVQTRYDTSAAGATRPRVALTGVAAALKFIPVLSYHNRICG
jgi:hypothetical protein